MEVLDSDMNLSLVVRKVVQDVVKFVFHKQGIIAEKPSPELSFVPGITPGLMKNLCLSVWIETYCNEFIWADFIKSHFKRMTTTPYLYANYVIFACYVEKCRTGSGFGNFIDTLSLVIHFALHCWQQERKEFLNTCVELFCAFFTKDTRRRFLYQGRWEEFDDYLVFRHQRLKRYKVLVDAGWPDYEIFREIQIEHQHTTEPYVVGEVVIRAITDQEVEDTGVAFRLAEEIADEMRRLCKQPLEQVLADFEKTERLVEEDYREAVEEAAKEAARIAAAEATGEIASGTEQSLQKDQQDLNVNSDEEEQSHLQKDQQDLNVNSDDEEQSPLQIDQQDLNVKADDDEPSFAAIDEASSDNASSKKNEDRTLDDLASRKSGDFGSATQITDPSPSSKKNEGQTLDDLASTKSGDFGLATQITDLSLDLTNAGRAKIIMEEVLHDIPYVRELIKFLSWS